MRVKQKALTFDDVLLVPAHSIVLPKDVSLVSRLTQNITLSIPIVSAAMDTVTESRLAIAVALEGGIGILHKNMSLQDQALRNGVSTEEIREILLQVAIYGGVPAAIDSFKNAKEIIDAETTP